MESQIIQVTQAFPALEVLSIVVSVIALISSAVVGYKQVSISRLQVDMQDKVELYLLSQPVTFRDANKQQEDVTVPAIYIRNIGNSVIYLESYKYNGEKHILGKTVLPPVSHYDGFYYIFLPTNEITHISFEIHFRDWKNQPWKTLGIADLKDGIWKITHYPCERRIIRRNCDKKNHSPDRRYNAKK